MNNKITPKEVKIRGERAVAPPAWRVKIKGKHLHLYGQAVFLSSEATLNGCQDSDVREVIGKAIQHAFNDQRFIDKILLGG